MPPVLQPQLRSAARSFAQQSSKPIQRPSQRDFHQSFFFRATEPSRDGGDAHTNSISTPVASSVPEFEEISKDLEDLCAKDLKLKELFADFTKKRAEIQKLLRKQDVSTPDKVDDRKKSAHGTSGGDEPPSKPESVKSPFHGSALRRRQRANASRDVQKIVQMQAPQWFLDWNVQLVEEHHGLEGFASLTGVVERSRSASGKDPTPDHPGPVTEASQKDTSSDQHLDVPLLKEKHSTFEAQLRELEIIARGLLRLPTNDEQNHTITNHDGPHLILDHQDQWVKTPGAVWRDLVEDLATRLDCDFVVLNAQDIGDLISSAKLGDEITADALSLNYDVWNKILKAREFDNVNAMKPRLERFDSKRDAPRKDEDMDDGDDFEEMDNFMPSFGAPMIIGKPFTIDITKMLRSQAGKRGGSRKTRPSSIMSALFDDQTSKPNTKKDSHIFSEVVSSVLSAPEEKRSKAGPRISPVRVAGDLASNSTGLIAGTKTGQTSPDPDSMPRVTQRKLLIYIQALDVLEEHSIGQQFLSELYLQVHHRRMSGQEEIIVGAPPYVSEERTDWLSGLDTGNVTRKVALTPPDVAPQDVSRLRRLSVQNITAINYRNLRTMLQTKWNTEAWESFDPRSPTFLDDVAKTSSMPETISLWEVHFVRRLAAVIWGMLEQNPDKSPQITEALALLDESARSKAEWRKQRSKDRPSHLLVNPEDSQINRIRSSATKHEKALLAGVIEPSKISVTFKDVHAPFETIEAIQTMTTLSLVRPEAFRYGVLASDRLPGLLLYGPPGTGKTLLAKAVAKESGATVLSVSSAQLNDMYVGEGEKNVAALFSLAKKLTPCVIFLDEADAIFSARGNRGSRVNHRELLNQFLTEWDGMSNDASGAFIMVATNRPMDLDDAVLRRLPRRLLIDLPTESDRLAILNIHLRDEVLAECVDLADLAKKTPFYSGSDLKNLAVAAALECVREENEAAKNHVGVEEYKHAAKRTLTSAHFEKALGEISASISEDMTSLRDIKKFDEQYGDKRGKKRKSARWGFSTAAEADKVLDTVKVRS